MQNFCCFIFPAVAQCWCHGNNRSSECEIRMVVSVVVPTLFSLSLHIYLDFCPSGQGDIKCLHVYSSQIIIEHILSHLQRSLKMGIIAEKFAYLQKKQ